MEPRDLMKGDLTLAQYLDFRNGRSSPPRNVTGEFEVFGSNGVIGRADVRNVLGQAIVIGRVGSYCGGVYYAARDSWVTENAIICTAKRVVETRFWFYALQLLDLNGRSSGSGQPLLNQAVLMSISFEPPDHAARIAVGNVLGALDDKIAANSRVIATADKLARALTRSSLNIDDHVALSERAQVTMGSSPPGTSYNEIGEGIVFYQGVRDFGIRYPSNRVWTTAPLRYAETLDCLMSVRAPVGELNLAAEKTCIGRGVASVRSISGTPMTLFHVLRDAPDVWAPYEAGGTIFGSINRNELESLRVPTVRNDRAKVLEQELTAVENLIASLLSESAAIGATRDALLPLLMSGKLRVKDAEKQVEAQMPTPFSISEPGPQPARVPSHD